PVLVRKLELVGCIDLGHERDRLDGRTLEAERLRAVAFGSSALDLETAAQRVRVVLERDHALQGRRVRVDQHEAAFDELGGTGKAGHETSFRMAAFTFGASLPFRSANFTASGPAPVRARAKVELRVLPPAAWAA